MRKQWFLSLHNEPMWGYYSHVGKKKKRWKNATLNSMENAKSKRAHIGIKLETLPDIFMPQFNY